MGLGRRHAPRHVAALCLYLSLGLAASARADSADEKPVAPGAATSAPDDACRQRAIQAVQKRYEGIRDIRARFVQTTRGVAVDRTAAPTVSKGSVVVAKPSRMRWSYESPEPSLVVSDGKTLWIYDPGFKEVQRAPVDGGFFSGAALQFLLGRGDMEREFIVRAIACSAESAELELAPRAPTSYEKLRLVTDPRSGNVSQTRIDDLLGNSTIVDFTEIEVNLDPPAELFRFDPPEGVRVIDLAPPGA
jgi:outer membrane lipoprotein carrier protein